MDLRCPSHPTVKRIEVTNINIKHQLFIKPTVTVLQVYMLIKQLAEVTRSALQRINMTTLVLTHTKFITYSISWPVSTPKLCGIVIATTAKATNIYVIGF